MIRIIVRTDDAEMAVNVGGTVESKFQTFDMDLPELEVFLTEPSVQRWKFAHRQVIGVEVVAEGKDGKHGS